MKRYQTMKRTVVEPLIHFKSAFQFLTILPLGRADHFDPQKAMPLFPLVGLVLGLLLAVFDLLVGRLWPEPVAALLDVLFMMVITGALHLDGLGDTADGLYGGRTTSDALRIMKDSRIGTMGLVAIVSGLAVKWGGIYTLQADRFLLLTIVPALARGSTLFGFRYLEYGRAQNGTGHAFFTQRLGYKDFKWLLVPLGLSLFSGWRGLWMVVLFGGLTAAILYFYKWKLGCITGDLLGAMTELLEAFLFLFISIT